MTFSEWWLHRERENAAHFVRDAFVCWLVWMGMLLLGWPYSTIVSFAAALAFAVGWEIRDELAREKTGGWDWYDIAAGALGAAFVHVVHYSVHWLD